jgi:hypothetical protein
VSAKREFCTLFDSNYLIKAVAMYRSLERNCRSFHLTAFCFDEVAEQMLSRLGLDHISVVSLPELEAHDPALLSVKPDRTPLEYCWTATPALPLVMLETRPELDEITYLDADLLFFADPELLFEEMGDASVMITPHRFSPEYAAHEINGIYNVQFMTFRRDEPGLTALRWWHDRCIEWCYYRFEDGKLGDQKYLDDWPERFQGVHVLEHKGGGLAPWNASQYRVWARGREIFVDEQPLVFFHYHRVRMRRDDKHDWHPPGFHVPRRTRRLIYPPYLRALETALAEIQAVAPGFDRGIDPPRTVWERIDAARIRADEGLRRRVPLLQRVHPLSPLFGERGRGS